MNSLFQVSFLADTKFPVAISVVSNPGENVSLKKNTRKHSLQSDNLSKASKLKTQH